MDALSPRTTGRLRLRGYEVGYDTYGDPAAPAVLLLPTWQVVHRRHWKMQIPFLAQHRHVIAVDVAGNGLGERTTDRAVYEYDRVVDQLVGVLDHLKIEQADALGFSLGTRLGVLLAARHPERVSRLVLIGTGISPDGWPPARAGFWERRERYDGWQKANAHFWRENYQEYLKFFFREFFPEPHSTKAIEDGIAWGQQTAPEILIATSPVPTQYPSLSPSEAIDRVRCPVLIIHGTDDRIVSNELSRQLVRARPDFELVEFEGSGHGPHLRDPVRVNLELQRFLQLPAGHTRSWTRGAARRDKRVLWVCSPIGLGHVQRDRAIARELRKFMPDLRIDWLAQHPVTRVLREAGESIHPLSARLSSESAHWEQSASGHELHCFYAWRAMDEILLANFMVFLDAARETNYDLWIGDEAWDVDHYLHENPELKTAPYVFMTDFIGWLPVDATNDPRERELTTDYNAEMLGQIDRYPRIRDRALYFGEYEDIVPHTFGRGLPRIREWTRAHFDAVGYVTPVRADEPSSPADVKRRFGLDPDRQLAVVAVGGTAVGAHLLGKIVSAWPAFHAERPDVQGLVVAGPRIQQGTIPDQPGLRVRGYVDDLYKLLAVADLGVVQGGLTTTMELTAGKRPFIYFPLGKHCEQLLHVAHRLDRYCAGRRMQYEEASAQGISEAMTNTIGASTASYRGTPVRAGETAARKIAELL